MEAIVEKTLKNFKKNGFYGEYFENITLLNEYLLKEIEVGMSVGVGGSKTIEESKIVDDLLLRGNKVLWHWLSDESSRMETLLLASTGDVYLSSSNGITCDGKIVNIDGLGNRISSLCYGHKKVYIVVGVNKISEDIRSSIERIKTKACPKNAERLNLNTPCRYTGKCYDCSSKDRMCNITCILDKQPMNGNITVCIVNDLLGY